MTQEFYFITHQYGNTLDKSCHIYQYGKEAPNYLHFLEHVKRHITKNNGWPFDKTVLIDIQFLTKHESK